jgi:hypothetical protein
MVLKSIHLNVPSFVFTLFNLRNFCLFLNCKFFIFLAVFSQFHLNLNNIFLYSYVNLCKYGKGKVVPVLN